LASVGPPLRSISHGLTNIAGPARAPMQATASSLLTFAWRSSQGEPFRSRRRDVGHPVFPVATFICCARVISLGFCFDASRASALTMPAFGLRNPAGDVFENPATVGLESFSPFTL
jgi:hypothetical protein